MKNKTMNIIYKASTSLSSEVFSFRIIRAFTRAHFSFFPSHLQAIQPWNLSSLASAISFASAGIAVTPGQGLDNLWK